LFRSRKERKKEEGRRKKEEGRRKKEEERLRPERGAKPPSERERGWGPAEQWEKRHRSADK
jgi:hypothetical protein